MALHNGTQRKIYVSTFRMTLKPRSAWLAENGTHGQQHLVPEPVPAAPKDVVETDALGKNLKNSPASPMTVPSQKSLEQGSKVVSLKRRANSSTGLAVKFVEPPEKLEVQVGETAVLSCAFTSSEPVASCWIHNKQQVMLSEDRSSITSDEKSSSLLISDVRPEDAGNYTIVVRNRSGSAQHSIRLNVVDRPHPPASCPFVSQLSSSSVELSWSGPGYDGGSAITGYVVEYRRVDAKEQGDWNELTSQCKNTSYRVPLELDPQGEYRFRVRAVNPVGISDPSKESDSITVDNEDDVQEEAYVDVFTNTANSVKDHYDILERLGVGKFGQVFRLKHKKSGQVSAGKFFRGRGMKERAAARKEIELMKELHHPKLVQFLGAYDSRLEVVMILEYIGGRELFERIMDDGFEYTEPTSVCYMRQILEGIQYIHKKNIVHLDLKPENIVCVNRKGTLVKIIDFGLACKLEPGKALMVMHGTPEFVAPEVISYEPVGLAADMWSIGVICYILLSGESPFQGSSDAETLALVTEAQCEFDPESFRDITEGAKVFIRSLLQRDKRARLTCERALAHPWMVSFASVDPRTTKSLNKEKMRRFLAKRKWTKAGKAVLALKRMTHLSSKSDGPDSPSSPGDDKRLGPKAEQALQTLEQSLRTEPRFQQTLKDLSQPRGSTVRFFCTIYGYPDPDVVWLQDEEPVEEMERLQVEYEEDGTCTLIISDLRPEDSGMYTCCASNSMGVARCSARLSVEL